MIDIYICDDEAEAGKLIQSEIEKKILIEDYDMQVAYYAKRPQVFLDTVGKAPKKRNVYFLDVELKDAAFDGFLLGKEIRKLDPHGTIIFVTSFQNLAYRTFQYHLEAFDYIVKDPAQLKTSIGRCLESLHQRLKDETKNDIENVYTVKIGDTLKHVPLKDILCFETSSKPHHVILHTRGGRMDFVGSLNEIGEQMGSAFIRTHRSYLVASDKITEIDLKHSKVKAGNLDCLVSRKMKSALLERMKESGSLGRQERSEK